MYKVTTTGETFDSFLSAVAAAKSISSEVFEVSTGLRRWAPAEKVSSQRIARYREQLAAYKAQKAAK